MSNYIPNKQKKNKIFHKRERELRHAIRHGFDAARIEKAALVLREAKLAAIRAQFDMVRSPEKGRLLKKWAELELDDIVKQYSKGVSTQ